MKPFLPKYIAPHVPSVRWPKLWRGQKWSRIAPISMIVRRTWSSWRDLSFETHFVFRWFFSRRAVDGCSVDGRRMIFGRPFSHDKIRWISKIQISNFKFQISNFNWPGLGPVRAVPSVRAVPPQPWPIEIWNLKFKIWNLNFWKF